MHGKYQAVPARDSKAAQEHRDRYQARERGDRQPQGGQQRGESSTVSNHATTQRVTDGVIALKPRPFQADLISQDIQSNRGSSK